MIKIILIDCDGVLTDGTYVYSKSGKEFKIFSAIDSKGILRAKKKDIYMGVISEDPTGYEINMARCKDLDLDYFKASSPEDKLQIAKNIAFSKGCSLQETAFIADDIGDILVLEQVGFPAAVANATEKVKSTVLRNKGYISMLEGGKGAVREIIEYILDNKI